MSRAWCRWCGAEIRWAKTTSDKNIPLDPCPTLEGRWRTWKPAHVKPTNPT